MATATPLRRAVAGVLVLALVMAPPLAARAQSQDSSPPPVFFETVDVRVIDVEVVVTDRGRRVPNLGPEDFRVRVDGIETPIDFFTEVADGQATTSLVQVSAQAPSSAPVVQGDPVPTRFLVFVDNLFSVGHYRNQVLDALEQSLDQLGAYDTMAIVAFDGHELTLLSGWERDPGELAEAFEKARSAPTYGLHRLAELRVIDDWRDLENERIQFLVARTGGAGSGNPFGAGEGDELSQGDADIERAFDALKNLHLHKAGGAEVDYSYMVASQIRSTSLAAAAAMREFAGAHGRKAMLLLAGGWPSSALEYAISDGTQSAAMMIDASLTRAQMDDDDPLVPMTDAANLLGYTLYPIDVPGFRRADRIGDGATGDSPVTIDEPEPTDLGVPQRNRELFHHDSLDFVADETGGEALINAQRLQALPTVYADTRDYYWLGFSRDREDDDLHHEIEIEVLRRGVEVRSRTGFIDLSAEAEGDQKVEAALLFDSFAGTSPLELSLGVPLQPYKRKLEVPLDVRIPLESVTMVETAGAFVGELEVRISVMDKEGNQASSEVRALSVEGEGPPAEGSFYTYSTLLEIRNRDHKVVVGVQDILGGGSLAGTAKLDSPYSR